MEATHKRNIKNGYAYDRYFPPAKGDVLTVRKNATLEDTVTFIPKVVRQHLGQTKRIANILKGSATYDTCANIWHFVYDHIQYEKDQHGFEQIRSPARAWHDRRQGVDCDCYSVFISTILLNLGIPHILRITQYRKPYFQHIYPVVPAPSGEIILDCVANQFDFEVPYTAKKDFPMDLQLLNGLDDPNAPMGEMGDFPEGYAGELGDLGKLKLKINFKKVLNAVNKLNPATVLLRNGLLASMKLNIGGVAGKLRWSYATPAQAAAKGITAQKLAKLIKVRNSLEKIFYGAGGNLKNLKKAILKGKGNKDKAVLAGLGSLGDWGNIDNMNLQTPLSQLLGPDIYYSENERTFQGFDGFGELGEPITLASVGAASGVVAAIAAALKKIGDLFSAKGEGSRANNTTNDSGVRDDNAASYGSGGGSSSSSTSADRSGHGAPSSYDDSAPAPSSVRTTNFSAGSPAAGSAGGGNDPAGGSDASQGSGVDDGSEASSKSTTATALTTPVLSPSAFLPTGPDSPSAPKASFWSQNKGWLKPVVIGVGGITLLAIGYHVMKPKPHPGPPLSGVPGRHKNHPRKSKQKKAAKKKAVALL